MGNVPACRTDHAPRLGVAGYLLPSNYPKSSPSDRSFSAISLNSGPTTVSQFAMRLARCLRSPPWDLSRMCQRGTFYRQRGAITRLRDRVDRSQPASGSLRGSRTRPFSFQRDCLKKARTPSVPSLAGCGSAKPSFSASRIDAVLLGSMNAQVCAAFR